MDVIIIVQYYRDRAGSSMYFKPLSVTATVVLTSDSAQAVRILELTLKDNGDVTTNVNGQICYFKCKLKSDCTKLTTMSL